MRTFPLKIRQPNLRELEPCVRAQKTLAALTSQLLNSARRVSQSDARHLRDLDTILDKPVLHSLLVSMDPRVRSWEGSITALPAPWLLSGNADSRHRHH